MDRTAAVSVQGGSIPAGPGVKAVLVGADLPEPEPGATGGPEGHYKIAELTGN